MRIKDSLPLLIGKTISGIVIGEYPKGDPATRYFLTFADGTAFEFWKGRYGMEMASGLDNDDVEQIIEMLNRRPGAKIHVCRPAHEDQKESQRDLLIDRG